MMHTQDVFEVVEIKPVENGDWVVGGRAYEDLEIGDLLYPRCQEVIDPMAEAPFEIVDIVTYGRTLGFLSRAMTGYLTLRGTHGERLQGADLLVRQLPVDATAALPGDTQVLPS